MQIVINIRDELYDEIQKGDYDYNIFERQAFIYTMLYNIINSTPLPKGHGRLIDANRLRSMYSINRANFNTVVGIQKWIDDAPTIIEADNSESEEV